MKITTCATCAFDRFLRQGVRAQRGAQDKRGRRLVYHSLSSKRRRRFSAQTDVAQRFRQRLRPRRQRVSFRFPCRRFREGACVSSLYGVYLLRKRGNGHIFHFRFRRLLARNSAVKKVVSNRNFAHIRGRRS